MIEACQGLQNQLMPERIFLVCIRDALSKLTHTLCAQVTTAAEGMFTCALPRHSSATQAQSSRGLCRACTVRWPSCWVHAEPAWLQLLLC